MIVVVASFHVPCFSYSMPQNILGTIFLRLQLTLPSPQCMYHALTKLCSQSVLLCSYYLLLSPYYPHTTMHS